MTPERRAEILVLRDTFVVFDEADVPARVVARLLTEVLRDYDFVCESLAKIEEKVDELTGQLAEEKAKGDRLSVELHGTKAKLEEAERDRDNLVKLKAEEAISLLRFILGVGGGGQGAGPAV